MEILKAEIRMGSSVEHEQDPQPRKATEQKGDVQSNHIYNTSILENSQASYILRFKRCWTKFPAH